MGSSKWYKKKQGKTVADKALDKYIPWISDEVYKQYGLGNTNTQQLGGHVQTNVNSQKLAWHSSHSWTQDKENFIIKRTKLYIRVLDSEDSNSTNLQFIEALVKRIALYLSAFCRQGGNRSMADTQRILYDALYKNNSYIRGMELYQRDRRINAQSRNKKYIATQKKQEHIMAQKKNREIRQQVHFMFVEVASYRKK